MSVLNFRKGTKKIASVQIFKTQMHIFFIFVTGTGIFCYFCAAQDKLSPVFVQNGNILTPLSA